MGIHGACWVLAVGLAVGISACAPRPGPAPLPPEPAQTFVEPPPPPAQPTTPIQQTPISSTALPPAPGQSQGQVQGQADGLSWQSPDGTVSASADGGALPPAPPVQSGGDADFQAWLAANITPTALARGVSQQTIDAAFAGLSPIQEVIDLDRNQPESRLTFEEYLARTVTLERIAEGKRLLVEHRDTLQRVAASYGVQPRFIVALWGTETNFGGYMGDTPVIGALATLAYDGRRRDYFSGELVNALVILQDGHITPQAMIGSWAGAMGQCQFMPSSFLRFAVDFTGDGRKDIWGTEPDVFASAANYLSGIGWNDDYTWGRAVALPDGFNTGLADVDSSRPLSAWQDLGVRLPDGGDLPSVAIDAALVLPDGAGGRAYLAYDNYQVLLGWNRSTYFATSIGLLSDAIAAGLEGV